MDIHDATAAYEVWLAGQCDVDPGEIAYKHRRMTEHPFPFFRGTYYHWLMRRDSFPDGVRNAPTVLAIGDVHIENFGTWRDRDARLVWGVNDFDEADDLPYTHDLLRLATSVRLAARDGAIRVRFGKACRAMLKGYRESLKVGGSPFVLEENHPELRAVAVAEERDPVVFWKKLTALLPDGPVYPPREVRDSLERWMPAPLLPCEYRLRPQVGVGSLGKPRYVAFAQWSGGWVAREAKRITAPATAWAGRSGTPSRIGEVLAKAVRCPDPFFQIDSQWIIRRLAPRCSRIELEHLTNAADLIRLVQAMGAEIANIHLGSASAVPAVLDHLDSLPDDWLETSARATAKQIRADWKAWCNTR